LKSWFDATVRFSANYRRIRREFSDNSNIRHSIQIRRNPATISQRVGRVGAARDGRVVGCILVGCAHDAIDEPHDERVDRRHPFHDGANPQDAARGKQSFTNKPSVHQ
jgi:hypothetical protein